MRTGDNRRVTVTFVALHERQDDALLREVYDGLYRTSFPRVEERESLEGLAAGHVIVARADDGTVEGFAAAEYYPRSHCGLLSYLAVDAAERGRGLSRALFDQAADALHRDAAADGGTLAAIFGEIHDPARIAPEDDVIAPWDRQRIMHRLGARRVPIAYVQPGLAPGAGRARGLMLVAFGADTLPTQTVRAFLSELYAELGASEDDADLDRTFVGLDADEVELDPLVLPAEPHLSFAAFGIGFHFPGTGDARPDVADVDLGSFEEDILAYAYRDAPPFRTHVVAVPEDWARITARFGEEIAFVSEGRSVLLEAPPRTVSFLLRASRTDFAAGGRSILHLVLGPDPGGDSAPTEYDLITLAKLWTGGEGLDAAGTDAAGRRYVTFAAAGADRELTEIAANVFGEATEVAAPRVGTIQLLHEICAPLVREMQEIVRLQGGSTPSPEAVVAGGLIQGLFDFAEIDGDELADVFKEVHLEEELISCFHKGTLLVVSSTDRAFSAEKVRQDVGLSPYLLVPHAVLTHNEFWLQKAIATLDGVGRTQKPRLRQLARARGDVAETLAVRLIPNLFHYDEEQQLFDRGRRHRAQDQHHRTVERRLAAVEAELASRHNALRSIVAGLLPVLALVFTWLDALSKYDHTVVYAVLIPTTLLTIAALAFVWLWRD